MTRGRPHGPRRTLGIVLGLVVALIVVGCSAPATRPAIAGVPRIPIGWNSWNAYGCDVDQAEIESAADAMVSSGMRATGYRYVVLDDCWVASTRDTSGHLRADPTRFPDGIAALASYVHARGLRIGLYTSATSRTCAQRTGAWPGSTGSGGHERVDAATFARWGVDLVKDDWCGASVSSDGQRAAFAAFRDGIRATGRSMVLSINPNSGVSGDPGADEDWSGIATMVRISHDVVPVWSTAGTGSASLGIREQIAGAEAIVQQGGTSGATPDADMLVVGHSAVTPSEQRSEVSMLAMLGLPLMAGTPLASMPPRTRALLVDPELVRLATSRRDPARRMPDRDGAHVWVRGDGDRRVVAVYNPTGRPVTVSVSDLLGRSAWSVWAARSVRTSAVTVAPRDTGILRVGR